LGQQQELRLHIRVALRNGLTRKEVAEALLHTAPYCGIPRAADARRAMVEVFEQLDAADKAATRPGNVRPASKKTTRDRRKS
jgi:3-hydroxyisobutyrate dehydrogenase